MTEIPAERFRNSHRVHIINFDADQTDSDVPAEWKPVSGEVRSRNQQWLYLTPLASP